GPARIAHLLGLVPSTVHRVLTRYGLARLTHLQGVDGCVPGAVHDFHAAREHGMVDALAEADIRCWTDKGYRGAGDAVCTPWWGRWETLSAHDNGDRTGFHGLTAAFVVGIKKTTGTLGQRKLRVVVTPGATRIITAYPVP
ncbi:hypothetical protein ACGFYD_41545, partial [Streptomyces sp. NPDC048508]